MNNILVPTDFSVCANAAIETAFKLAHFSGAKIHLFHVAAKINKTEIFLDIGDLSGVVMEAMEFACGNHETRNEKVRWMKEEKQTLRAEHATSEALPCCLEGQGQASR